MRTLLATLFSLGMLAASAQSQKLTLGWADKDVHYEQAPQSLAKLPADTLIRAWRGERVGMQALLSAPAATGALQLRVTEWKGKAGSMAASQAKAHFLRYVLTDNFQACGTHPANLQSFKVADVVSTDASHRFDKAATQPLWVTVEVPRDAKPGRYSSKVEVLDSLSRKVIGRMTLQLEVLSRTLPKPSEQQFHVDFWQQPYAVSRYHGVKRWSDAHFALLKPYLELLARGGQKVCSAILFYEPWGDQSHDKFDPMIRTTRRADGSWTYDYTVFDRWVRLCEECGIGRQINCFSMVPWDMSFRYFDEAQGREVNLRTQTSSPEYRELWTAFLKDFAAHLRQRGWYDKTCIAMDERGLSNMLDAYRIAQEAVPGMKMALAGNYHAELVDKLYDYCIAYGQDFKPEELAGRRAKGWVSTTYTCCSTPEPNLFSNSLPADAAYLPVYCVANGFDGYLHWSWMNWPDEPLTDTRYRLFAPGDTYLIYPGPASSVRWERFIEGVALAEKVRLRREALTAEGKTAELQQLNRLVEEFRPENPERPTSELVGKLQDWLNR